MKTVKMIMARLKHAALAGSFILGLSACTTLPDPAPAPSSSASTSSSPTATAPTPAPAPTPSGQTTQESEAAKAAELPSTDTPTIDPPTNSANPAPVLEVHPAPPAASPVNRYASAVAGLEGWRESDVTPALASFQRSCIAWASKPLDEALHSARWEYGRYSDWAQPCAAAAVTNLDFGSAHDFFERYFTPVSLTGSTEAGDDHSGLLTGYYQPEIEVRRRADVYFNEPILAVPKSEAARSLPRGQITAATSRVIGYGRPLDVFFMQVQGSGHLRYENGAKIRAAYAGNNAYPYTSIGKVLIDRGELTKERSSKADIERWMAANGPAKARELMNQNKRYIFFVEEKINLGEGPKGAMRVPLTAMGSMAVDPSYYPYGALVWMSVKLPQSAGDYRGTEQGILLSAQDTGKAIRGAMRGDLYFGSGQNAGALAGVMKHRAAWSILLPSALAAQINGGGMS